MEFLKAILGEELYSQFESKINEYNGSEANKDKQVKIGNISTGEYVNKSDYDALNETLKGKETELATANTLIADLKKATNLARDMVVKYGFIARFSKRNVESNVSEDMKDKINIEVDKIIDAAYESCRCGLSYIQAE